MPRTIWLTLPDGTEYELDDRLAIGRAPENDLALTSKQVSREHAVLNFRDGRWFLEDRGSYNGTFLNGTRLQPGVPLPLRHADRISIGPEELVFSWPAQREDPNSTDTYERLATGGGPRLSHFQTQVVRCLCEQWLAGASLESLPSNDQIAAQLGTPGAEGTVKAALRRVYTKAGLAGMPAHAKRRALCRIARQRGWI
jgi:hypothetical protein